MIAWDGRDHLGQSYYKRVDNVEKKKNKKELILEAAQNIFFEKGYHDTTSEEIAKVAGVGKGTLYQYFESKQDIFLEMHQQYIQAYYEKLKESLDMNNSFAENMRLIARFNLKHIQSMMQYVVSVMPVLMTLDSTPKSYICIEKSRMWMDDLLGQMIELGQQRGELKQMDKQLLLYSITGAFMGFGHIIATKQFTEAEKEQLSEELVTNILYGIMK